MGVTVETTKEGDKKTYPKPGDAVTMDYTGTLEDGTVGWRQIIFLSGFGWNYPVVRLVLAKIYNVEVSSFEPLHLVLRRCACTFWLTIL